MCKYIESIQSGIFINKDSIDNINRWKKTRTDLNN